MYNNEGECILHRHRGRAKKMVFVKLKPEFISSIFGGEEFLIQEKHRGENMGSTPVFHLDLPCDIAVFTSQSLLSPSVKQK